MSVSVLLSPFMCLDDILLGHLLEKSCSFGWSYIPFVLCLFVFSCFPLWFRGQDFGSDCTSSRSLLTIYFSCQTVVPLLHFIVRQLQENHLPANMPLYMISVDIEDVFDRVPRDVIRSGGQCAT